MHKADGAGRWQSRGRARGTGSVHAGERTPVAGAAEALRVVVLVIASLATVLSAAGSVARGTAAPGLAARRTPAEGLCAVAGDVGTGVAAGVGVLWWSTPGHLVWHPAAGVDSTLIYTAVVKAGGRYLATAEDGSVWISADADGKSFFRRATAAARPLRAIAEVGGLALVAVGDSGTIARCPDRNGAFWTTPASKVTAHLRGIACNGVSTVAVGDRGTLLRAGSPGIEWQVVAIDETRDLLAVTTDPRLASVGRYLAMGRDGALWRGEGDGLTWTRLDSFTTGALHGAAWVGPSAVVVGDAGAIFRSPGSFENWVPAVSGVTTSLRAVALAGAELLAIGADGTVLWSPKLDGHEWRRAEVPVMVPVQEVSWGRVKQLFRR